MDWSPPGSSVHGISSYENSEGEKVFTYLNSGLLSISDFSY